MSGSDKGIDEVPTEVTKTGDSTFVGLQVGSTLPHSPSVDDIEKVDEKAERPIDYEKGEKKVEKVNMSEEADVPKTSLEVEEESTDRKRTNLQSVDSNQNQCNTTQENSVTEHIKDPGGTQGNTTEDANTDRSIDFTGTEDKVYSEDSRRMFTVTRDVQTDEGIKTVTIHVLNDSQRKPYLGGFRHRLTGVEYYNASAQTFPKPPSLFSHERFHRDTQTIGSKSKSQQTFNNTSTQMTKTGCYISDVTDKILIPGKYVSADEIAAIREEKVIILQTHWRRWLATQYVKKLRADKYSRLDWEKEEQLRREEERKARAAKEFMQRTNPQRKEDFDLLFAALEKWRLEEIERINATRSGAERKAALVLLLEQEAYLIQSIEKHKIHAQDVNRVQALRKFLDKAAAPRRWRSNYDGKITTMDTPNTMRAKQLRDMYNSLQMSYLTADERLDILQSLKEVVMEHECQLTKELIELVERETDLLSRGVKNQKLEGLRQRIITLFMQYCKTPLFNPEIAKHLKVPHNPLALKKDIFFCPSCNAYLPSSEFSTTSNARIIGRCIKCTDIDNDARMRQDFSKFRNMLRRLRQNEEKYQDGAKMAFFIQDGDFHYLVENIWNSQSCLSAWNDLQDLEMLRWNRHEEWTPWNCILLTQEEADAHLKLVHVNEAYGRIFIGKVHHRHVLARTYFSKLNDVTKQQKEDTRNQRIEVTLQT